ncbi:hypothetical protein TKV_c21580 [Thermoanaerobacter kivui]|uniref:Uncharacterized protein n=1 Tax=Thermoanaerobacter kivui TaxID=2325 RepID=A0A097AU08_THEKI|nr:hypothetical protein [Thermoanaerobacter kivui]AIS53290.1 hypothetical protein TKV_c21580 [Thermoanaerobacter kivui]
MERPLYVEISKNIREMVSNGILKPGERSEIVPNLKACITIKALNIA